jgi:hypothetical protein
MHLQYELAGDWDVIFGDEANIAVAAFINVHVVLIADRFR